LKSLHQYRNQLDSLINSIECGEWSQIQALLTHNQSLRPDFLNKND
jgi:arogenate dehydrogenase (NADP+)